MYDIVGLVCDVICDVIVLNPNEACHGDGAQEHSVESSRAAASAAMLLKQ